MIEVPLYLTRLTTQLRPPQIMGGDVAKFVDAESVTLIASGQGDFHLVATVSPNGYNSLP